MIHKYSNINVSNEHNIVINDLPLEEGDIVDVLVIQKHKRDQIKKLPLKDLPVIYTDPYEPAIEPLDWKANN